MSFIKEMNIQDMKKWSTRKHFMKNGKLMRYTRVMIKQIKQILILLSGNDVVEMLKGN